MIRRSVIGIDEDTKGGTVDLLIGGIPGNQGTPNVVADRKPKGQPKKDAEATRTKPAKTRLQVPVPPTSDTPEKDLDLLSRSPGEETSGISEQHNSASPEGGF